MEKDPNMQGRRAASRATKLRRRKARMNFIIMAGFIALVVLLGGGKLGGLFGGDDSGRGQDKETAFSVAQAKDHVGDTDVWVYGYIVGGDLTSSKCSFEGPFSSRTNIVLATKSTCTDKESCISVQLPSGKIRDALNLVDHEDNLGRKVFLKGDIVASYYGIVGVQSVSEYSF